MTLLDDRACNGRCREFVLSLLLLGQLQEPSLARAQLHMLMFAAPSSSRLTAAVVSDFRGQTTHEACAVLGGRCVWQDSRPLS